ncbi:bone morphogenetic protein 3-like, partial [Homarus americanus]|uniref:bone morphogenetic protein 3-like n=1 Tax=Homarus americanus TaxID=6706 RepID=UPI001C4499DC
MEYSGVFDSQQRSRYSTSDSDIQEVEVTRAVREAMGGDGEGRIEERGRVGVRVEELRRGRYVGREWVEGSHLSKTPPLLLVYSSDPAILDLAALGVSALNFSHIRTPHPHPKNAHRNPAHGKGGHYKRYTREADLSSQSRDKRSLEDPWEDVEMLETGVGGLGGNAHTHAILTNELPLDTHHNALTHARMPLLPQEVEREEEREERRQRRLQRKQRRRGRKDNLIPLPKNYSKTKWGEDTRLKNDRRRRRRRRRRRNRRLPEEWMAVAQNTLSNEANSLGSSGLAVGARACERHKLGVNFKDLGWDRFIVAPSSFDAFFCAGVCPNPLTK